MTGHACGGLIFLKPSPLDREMSNVQKHRQLDLQGKKGFFKLSTYTDHADCAIFYVPHARTIEMLIVQKSKSKRKLQSANPGEARIRPTKTVKSYSNVKIPCKKRTTFLARDS